MPPDCMPWQPYPTSLLLLWLHISPDRRGRALAVAGPDLADPQLYQSGPSFGGLRSQLPIQLADDPFGISAAAFLPACLPRERLMI